MHRVLLVLYTALVLGANAAWADMRDLEALREGSLKKLVFHAVPVSVPQVAFVHEDGGEIALGDWRGKYVLVNFWATWCAPCRKEMPSLDALQREMGGAAFEVLTIATGRNPPAAISRFLSEIGATGLPQHRDPKGALARSMGVFGLPITVILDPDGNEIARLIGDAEWDSDSALAIIRALVRPEI
jgi:thiol-disulfide isomerase/thioredoxin